jgi:acetyltransferase-like isoleucine patch superfamily enzyme
MSIILDKIRRIISSSFAALDIMPDRFRRILLVSSGIKIGQNTVIKSKCFFNSPNVEIGNGCFINRGFEYYDGQMHIPLIIEDCVFVGPNCRIVSVSHEIGSENVRAGAETFGAIKIQNGTWIGEGVTILPGVEISSGCVIGARSVVTKSTTKNGLYMGVPARRVKTLSDNGI